ncbi:MAG: hypothetical protein AAF420_10445 [Pseudomonadota bacterium]
MMDFLFVDRFNLLELILVAVVALFCAIGVMERILKSKGVELNWERQPKQSTSSSADECRHSYQYIGTLAGFNEDDHGGSIFRHRCTKCGFETLLEEKLGTRA